MAVQATGTIQGAALVSPVWVEWFVKEVMVMLNKVAPVIGVYRDNIVFTLYGCMILVLKLVDDDYMYCTGDILAKIINYDDLTPANICAIESIVFDALHGCKRGATEWPDDDVSV